ncbi:MAG: cytochrome b/b6 domain-containing protein [Pseudomonadota bacterium]
MATDHRKHNTSYVLCAFSFNPGYRVFLATLVAYPVRPFGLAPIYRWPEDSPMAAELVNSAHGFTADVILVLLILHAAAALYHQFVRRETVILRMMPRI